MAELPRVCDDRAPAFLKYIYVCDMFEMNRKWDIEEEERERLAHAMLEEAEAEKDRIDSELYNIGQNKIKWETNKSAAEALLGNTIEKINGVKGHIKRMNVTTQKPEVKRNAKKSILESNKKIEMLNMEKERLEEEKRKIDASILYYESIIASSQENFALRFALRF